MENANLQEIGKRIQLRRKQLGYTQDQLASMMDVSIQMISNLERGNKAIRIDNLINLSQILKISTDYILTGKMESIGVDGVACLIARLRPEQKVNVEKLLELIYEMCAV